MTSDHDTPDQSSPPPDDGSSRGASRDPISSVFHGTSSSRLQDAAAHEQLKRPDWRVDDRPIPNAPQYRICDSGDGSGLLGEGAQGSVWAAEDESGNAVAIKFVCLGHRERVKKVVATLAKIESHPNVIQVIGEPYDLADGLAVVLPRAKHSLFRYVECGMWKGDQQLDVTLLNLMKGAAAGIDHLNGHGIHHRDIKPANLLEYADGTVVVGDPDLLLESSKPIAVGSRRGTPGYVAPEVDEGGIYTRRADLFGLAITYVTLRTGRVDGRISDSAESSIVDKASHSDLLERHNTCTEFVNELYRLPLAIPQAIQAELDRGDALDAKCKYAEAVAVYEHAMDLAKAVGHKRALLKAQIDLGDVLARQGTHFERAKEVLDECLTDLKANPDAKSRSSVLYLLGHIAICEGRVQEGEALSREALACARSRGDRFQEGMSLLGVAHAEEMSGNLAEAHRLLDDAATVFRVDYRESKGNDRAKAAVNIAGTLSMKAELYGHEGKVEEVLACLAEAEDMFRASDHLDNLGRALVFRSRALFAKSKWDDGLKALDEASRIFRRIGNIHWLLRCYDMRARLAFQRQDQTTAMGVCLEAIGIAAEQGSPDDHVRLLGQTAALCRLNGLGDAAASFHGDAKRLAIQHNLSDLLVDLLLDEANLRRGSKRDAEDDDEGKRIVHEALLLLESLLVRCQVKGRRAHYMSRIGELHGRLRDLTEARSWFEQALRNFEEIGDAGGIADCLSHLAAAAREGDDSVEAIRLMESLLERSKGKPLQHFQAGAHHDLVALKLSQGDIAGARKHFDCATAIRASHPMSDIEDALRETQHRLESAEQSRRPPAIDLPTMIRELRAWTERYPSAADAILAFWYHGFGSQLWANCRAHVGVKLLVRSSSLQQFQSFVNAWGLLGDLFVYAAPFSSNSGHGIDVFPFPLEMLVPPTLRHMGVKSAAPLSLEQQGRAIIRALDEVPYFLTLMDGTFAAFPGDELFVVGRRYRVPDDTRKFMLDSSIDELITRRVIAMPVRERAENAALIDDMCVAEENRLLPVYFGSLPSDKGVSLERSMRLPLPQVSSDVEDPADAISRAHRSLLRFLAEVATDCDAALAQLSDDLRTGAGHCDTDAMTTCMHVLRFNAGPSEVCHPVLVVPA